MTTPEHGTPEPGARGLPSWVRLLDYLTVLAAILAVCLFTFGGFREHVAGIRISFRSWHRLAGLAVLLTAIRHARVRTPALPRALWADLTSFWRSEERRAVWTPFVATRLGVLVVGYLAVVTIGVVAGGELFRVSDNALENLPARWDAGWYLRIVTEGYKWDGRAANQQNVVFFPAFPILMRAVGLFFGKRWLQVGVMLALAAFLGALLYMYRLARELSDSDRANAAVWALAAYPFAVYYSAPYTESFYLLGSVATFYHVTRRQWGYAAGWGFFLSLCRPNGFLIAVPVAILVVQHAIREKRLPLAAIAPIVTPVIGILTYCLFLYVRFGDPLVWRKGQLAWGRVYVGIWPGITALFTDRFQHIMYYGFYDYTATQTYDMMHTAAAILVLASVWPTVRRFGLAYGAFTLVNILPPLILGGMMSIGRMTSVLFPVFLWLGTAIPPRHVPAWIAASCLLQGLISALFFTWRPAF